MIAPLIFSLTEINLGIGSVLLSLSWFRRRALAGAGGFFVSAADCGLLSDWLSDSEDEASHAASSSAKMRLVFGPILRATSLPAAIQFQTVALLTFHLAANSSTVRGAAIG